MVLARQFSFHRNYPLALLSSVTSLARLSLARAELQVSAELVLQLWRPGAGPAHLRAGGRGAAVDPAQDQQEDRAAARQGRARPRQEGGRHHLRRLQTELPVPLPPAPGPTAGRLQV